MIMSMSSTTYPFTPERRAQADKVDGCAGRRVPGTPNTYFDRQGFPCTLGEWAVMFEDHQYKRVRQDEVNGSTVSTVWLGLDHGYGGLPRSSRRWFSAVTMTRNASDIRPRRKRLPGTMRLWRN